MLRDAARFASDNTCLTDRIQQRCLTVVNVAHDRDDRRTGFRSSVRLRHLSITCSTSASETRTTLWPNSSMINSAVSASIVWFWVAIMPFSSTPSQHQTPARSYGSPVRDRDRLWQVHVAETFSRSADTPIAFARARSCLRFIAAIER